MVGCAMKQQQPVFSITRRGFVRLVGGAAAVWPGATLAQRSAVPTVGYVYVGSESGGHFVDSFRKGLGEADYVEGRNVTIHYRWAENQVERIADIMAELVRDRVAAIVTPGSLAATRVARAASPTTPVVFGIGGDPVSLGLVARLNQPGGNVTGVTFLNTELGRKRLAILQELVPEASRLAVLVNRNSPAAETTIADVKSSGRQVDTLYATNSAEIDAAFASLKQKPADALVVAPDVLFANNRKQTVALAAAQRIPAIYGARDFPDIGGLMSYGDNRSESYRQLGIYTGRILNGEKPADLPVMRAAKFEFIINLRTATSLGIKIPRTLLGFASEVIG
jgi:ABC-type uncharacterized transport system substrate-binding protein